MLLTILKGDGEYWQPNDEKQNNHEAIVYDTTISIFECSCSHFADIISAS